MTPQDIIAGSEKVKAVLKEMAPELQTAVLADVLAYWLAGHIVEESQMKTRALRKAVLDVMLQSVTRILPHAEAMIREHLKTVRDRRRG